MPTKYINTSLSQLKQYAEALERSIESDEQLIEDYKLDDNTYVVSRYKVMVGLLAYIQQDIQFIKEYEEQLEAYRKQLNQDEEEGDAFHYSRNDIC